jgi:hypothetical protein
MSLRLITAPTDKPVTLDEAKAQCRQDTASMGTDEDAILNAYIAAATAYVERYTGRALMTQTLGAGARHAFGFDHDPQGVRSSRSRRSNITMRPACFRRSIRASTPPTW